MMRAVLEESVTNKDRGAHWDAIIDGFAKLNTQRNAYVHGLWNVYMRPKQTSNSDPKRIEVYLRATFIEEDYVLGDARQIQLKELDDFAQDLGAFNARVNTSAVSQPKIDKEVERERASQGKLAPRP